MFEKTKQKTSVLINPSDLNQAYVRLVMINGFFVWALANYDLRSEFGESQISLLLLLIFASLYSVLFFYYAKYKFPEGVGASKRIMVIRYACGVGDLTACGGAIYFADTFGIIIFPFFMTVVIGFGFRFGFKYFVVNEIIALIIVVWLIRTDPYLSREVYFSASYVLGMILVPIYAAFLLAKYQKVLVQLDESNKARARFIANMSHELRTPLHAILLNTESLLEKLSSDPLNRSALRPLRVIAESSSYLKRLVDRVLDVSSSEAGAFTLGEPVTLVFLSLIAEATNIASAEARHKGVEVNLSVAQGTPPMFLGWPQQLQEVLINVIGNAAKFTNQGEITVRVNSKEKDNDHRTGFIVVEVSDSGAGIDPDRMASIFEPFVTGDDSRSRRNDGTGIGLTLTRQYLEAMHGSINIESELSKGTSVTISFPYELADETIPDCTISDFVLISNNANLLPQSEHLNRLPIGDYLSRPESIAGFDGIIVDEPAVEGFLSHVRNNEVDLRLPLVLLTSDAANKGVSKEFLYSISDLSERSLRAASALCASTTKDDEVIKVEKPKSILIIDDNDNNLKSSQTVLENAGHVVQTADSGEQGLSLIKENHYDLVFLDMHMPKLSGIEVIKKARENDTQELPPIVMLTADATRDAYEDAKNIGVHAFLTKPISASSLRKAVEEHANENDKWSVQSELRNDVDIASAYQEVDDLITHGTAPNDILEMVESYVQDFDSTLLQCSVRAARGETSVVEQLLHKLQGSAAAMHFGAVVKMIKDAGHVRPDFMCDNFLANAETYHAKNALLVSDLKRYLHSQF